MKTAVRWRPVTAVAGVIAVLSGCGGSNGLPTASGVAAPLATRGDLLYVANKRASDGVSVLTFPQGKLVARITQIGRVRGICSDTSGNVWMTTFRKGNGPFNIYKFRHGGTNPVEVRTTRRYDYACAVDPTTGNLAAVSYGGSEDGVVDIWPGGRKGRPNVYFVAIPPSGCAYDDNGDLFVDGVGSDGVALGEFVKGEKYFKDLIIGRNSGWAVGGVQWDGTYVTLGTATISGSASLYRIQVSGERGKIASMVHLQQLSGWPQFAIVNGEIVATQRGAVVRTIGLYEYPGGGKALDVFSGFDDPVGMTISVAPK
ncbi:MAG TPA: hypothetical protein VKR56_15195 [Candidatus Cybelea sp.]|nr:hypothetical protein [Candidatus Cybelea sp.]